MPGNRVVDAGAQSGCQGFGTMPGVRVGLLSPEDYGTNSTLAIRVWRPLARDKQLVSGTSTGCLGIGW